jgi:predicted P-loop ATPase
LRALGIVCRYDRFHDRFIVNTESSGDGKDLKEMALKLAEKLIKAFRFEPSVSAIEEAIIQLAVRNAFNPVLDYLDSLSWDGKLRLDRWLIVYLGADDTELNREFGRLALIAAVRRIRRPGAKFDQIVVLEGEMGKQKSMAIETMAGTENFSDQRILDLNDQRQQEATRGIWLYEIAELTGMRRADVEHVRAFCSRTHDRVRPAYGHSRVDQPRCCVFFATTNDDEYLKAADRRFWPVRTGTIDIEALRRDRDQLWAEASAREREGVSIVLDQRLWKAAGVEQRRREESDPWDDILADVVGTVDQGEEKVSSNDLLTQVLGIHISKVRDVDYKRLGRCMRRLGWDGPEKMRLNNGQTKGYSRPK